MTAITSFLKTTIRLYQYFIQFFQLFFHRIYANFGFVCNSIFFSAKAYNIHDIHNGKFVLFFNTYYEISTQFFVFKLSRQAKHVIVFS